MQIFKLNEQFLVDLNKESISTVKEFRKLLTRDKDRFKKQAQREFTFIYHYCDFASEFANYPEEEKKRTALTNAELDENLKIEKDEDLMLAIARYEEIKYKGNKALQVIKSAYNAIDKVTTYWNGATSISDADEANKMIASLSKIGQLVDSVKKLEEQVKKELAENTALRGGHEKGIDEDPE